MQTPDMYIAKIIIPRARHPSGNLGPESSSLLSSSVFSSPLSLSLSPLPCPLSSLLSSLYSHLSRCKSKSDDNSAFRPVTVDVVETRIPNASPRVTTILRFATRTPRSGMRGPEPCQEVTTVLRFMTRTRPIPVTVAKRKSKKDDSSAFRDYEVCATLANALRTLANACEHKRDDLWSPPGRLEPNLNTGTFLRSIQEKSLLPEPPEKVLVL